MTATNNEIHKLLKLVANTNPAQNAFNELMIAADDAESRGWNIRKGGYSPSSKKSIAYIYASKDGDETRIWECITQSAGYFQPLTAPKLASLKEAIDNLQ